MCRSVADGGLRCAGHTRPRYKAATFGTPEWDDAAAHYAATPAGRDELTLNAVEAAARGDLHREIALTTAVAAGDRLRAAATDTRTYVTDHSPTLPTPDARLDLEDMARNLQDPAWVAAWNATPVGARTPFRLYHGTTNPDVAFTGAVHFGDRRTAMDRLYNTVNIDEGEPAYLVEVDWAGDLHPPVPDTVANYVAHSENAHRWHDEFYDRMSEECDLAGVNEDEVVEAATLFFDRSDGGALAYVNNSEGDGDEPAVSLVMRAPKHGFTGTQIVVLNDDDWEGHLAY